MTAVDLPAIRALHAGVSKGPWKAGQGATSDGSELCTTYEQKAAFLALSLNDGDRPLWLVDNGEVIPAVTGDGPRAEANAAFIAAAPSIVTQLLAVVERVEKIAERLEKRVEQNNRNIANGIYDEQMRGEADAASRIAGSAAKLIRAAITGEGQS